MNDKQEFERLYNVYLENNELNDFLVDCYSLLEKPHPKHVNKMMPTQELKDAYIVLHDDMNKFFDELHTNYAGCSILF